LIFVVVDPVAVMYAIGVQAIETRAVAETVEDLFAGVCERLVPQDADS
jgi:hypothetical protein